MVVRSPNTPPERARRLQRNVHISNQDALLYKKAKKTFKKEVIKAKSNAWKEFCSEIETEQCVSKIIKALQNKDDIKSIPLLKHSNGIPATTPAESAKILLDKHFPNNIKPVNTSKIDNSSAIPPNLLKIINTENVKRAILTFGSKKAPGPEDIKPIVLKNSTQTLYEQITHLIKLSLQTGYTPTRWRDMKAIFLVKKGKKDDTDPKSFRPITLSNFILKTAERLIQWFLQENQLKEPQLNQHAYHPGRSCDTALSQVMNIIENAKRKGKKSLIVSLDCSGAFDNLQFDDVKKALTKLKIPQCIIRWYDHLSRNRNITTEINGITSTIRPTQGSGQGLVLSPIIWNLVIHSIQDLLKNTNVTPIVYADDILLIIEGNDINQMKTQMQSSINKITQWGKNHKLKFSPTKTQAILIGTNKETSLWMDNQQIHTTKEMTYLGVIFDKRLTFNQHINSRVEKGIKILNTARNMINKNWGLNPQKALWIYKAIVRPTVTYGCHIYGGKEFTQNNKKKLAKLQRLAAILTTSAHKSTPSLSLDRLLDLDPLHLHIKKNIHGNAMENTRFKLKNLQTRQKEI